MHKLSTHLGLILLLGLGLFGVSPQIGWAQTGPGGVGGTNGNSDLRIWLRADDGVSPTTDGSTVTGWANQAGTSNPSSISGNPVFKSSQVGGKPVVRFDGTDDGGGVDQFVFGNGNLDQVPNGENTLIVVSANSGSGNLNQAMVGFGDIPASGAQYTGRGLLYNLDNQTGSIDITLAAISGEPKGTSNDKLNTGDKAVSTSYNTTPFSIFSSTVETSNNTQDLLANGDFIDSGAAFQNNKPSGPFTGTPRIGERVIGDVAEVIAVDRRLNAAELTIVHNYLSTKYGITLEGTDIADKYTHDGSHPGDVVGVGSAENAIRKSPSGSKTVAQSSGLYLDASGSLPSQGYALYGHNDANLSFTSTEPPNDRSNVQKLAREWRVDLTNTGGSITGVEMGIDENVLPSSEKISSTSNYNDYFLYVDPDGDFSDGNATAYDLTNRGSRLFTNQAVDINDGDYVTIARIKRTVNFAESIRSELEDTAGDASGTVALKARINFKTATEITVTPSITNGSPEPTQGSDYDNVGSAGDWSFNPGPTSTRGVFDVIDDNNSESNTEFLEVRPSSLPNDLAKGDTTLFEYGIIDDDNTRKITYDSGNPSSVQEGNSGTKTQTFTVTLNSGETGPASADFKITGDATAGEDYEIVGASTADASRGTVSIADGDQTGTFEIDIIGDEIDEGNDETLNIELYAARNATLGSGPPSETFTINDDDPIPEVSFTSTNFSGEEGTTVDVTVELGAASGQDLDVTVKDDGSGDATGGGDDYTFSSETITIPAGNTQGTVSVPLESDGTQETTETIGLTIADTGTDAPRTSPSSASVSILDASGLGKIGPGGVGDASTLSVWLRANDGVTVQTGVSEWADQSGNGNDATQIDSGEQPAYGSTTVNGINLVTFDGSDDFLRSNVESLASGRNTVFSVSDANAASTVFGIDNSNFGDLRTLGYTDASTVEAFQDGATAGGAGGAGNLAVLASAFDGSDVINARVDGGTAVTATGASKNSDGTYAIVGGNPTNAGSDNDPELTSGNAFDGDLGEIIAYNTTLNKAQRLIVENYLAAKYNIGSLATDLYAGDSQGGSADRDADVIGVGQASDGSKHFSASGDGVTLSVTGGIDNGDFVLAGRKFGVTQKVNYTDISGVTDLAARLNEDRYLDIKGSLSIDLSFDLGDLGVGGATGDASNYILIRRGGTSGNWSEVSAGGVSVSGDVITFTDVSVSDSQDGYFTIGSTNLTQSPLGTPNVLAIKGTSGADGQDAAWRYMGVPVEGAVVSDVERADDGTKLQNINPSGALRGVWIYKDGSWQRQSASDRLANGRGFIVYMKDKNNSAIDLTLPLVPTSGSSPGDQDVTIGDGTPTGDEPLSQSATWHLLSNPYSVPYDLNELNSAPNFADDFQTTVHVFDSENGQYQAIETDPLMPGGVKTGVSPWQSFFAERQPDPTFSEFTFPSEGRNPESSNTLLYSGSKSQNQQSPRGSALDFKVVAKTENGKTVLQDEAVNLLFRSGATEGWDRYDATKLTPPTNKYVLLGPVGRGRDANLTMKTQESLPLLEKDDITVPLGLEVKNYEGNLSISLADVVSVSESWMVELIDTKGTADKSDDEEKVLQVGEEGYTFTVSHSETAGGSTSKSSQKQVRPLQPKPIDWTPLNASKQKEHAAKTAGDKPVARFQIHIKRKEVLPVEMVGFDVSVDGPRAHLKWKTASETNNAGFYVQHQRVSAEDSTAEPKEWKSLGFVEGSGTTQESQEYRFEAKRLDYGTHAFRLRQVDTDGTEHLSDVVRVEREIQKKVAIDGPNPHPVRDQANLDVTVRSQQQVTIQLYDLLGRRVRTFKRKELPKQETRRVQLRVEDLASGTYFLRVQGKQFQETRRMTVVR